MEVPVGFDNPPEGEIEQNIENRDNENDGWANDLIREKNSIAILSKVTGGITTLSKLSTSEAQALCILDAFYKLEHEGICYDVGGVHADNDVALWFYFTTTSGPSRTFLMNMFVCQRNPGSFSVGISDSNYITTNTEFVFEKMTMSNELYWQKFDSSQQDEVHYIKTFFFSEEDRVLLSKKILVIPLSINISPDCMLSKEIIQKIKGELDFGETLFKDQKPDFVLKSAEEKEFEVHKIVLAAHSPKLRDLVRDEDCKSLILNITNYEAELLLQYLYTGLIKDIFNQQIEVLLDISDKYQLNNLAELVKRAMKISMTSSMNCGSWGNVLSIAVMAEKYNFIDIQEAALQNIVNNPKVLESDEFKKIDNANLIKKILKYVLVNNCKK